MGSTSSGPKTERTAVSAKAHLILFHFPEYAIGNWRHTVTVDNNAVIRAAFMLYKRDKGTLTASGFIGMSRSIGVTRIQRSYLIAIIWMSIGSRCGGGGMHGVEHALLLTKNPKEYAEVTEDIFSRRITRIRRA